VLTIPLVALYIVPREPRSSPDEAVLRCHAGQLAMKGNMGELAIAHFQRALALNPFLWEAIEGMCQLGKSDVTLIEPCI